MLQTQNRPTERYEGMVHNTEKGCENNKRIEPFVRFLSERITYSLSCIQRRHTPPEQFADLLLKTPILQTTKQRHLDS